MMRIGYLMGGGVICTLTDDDNWINVDYIIMLHGNYPEIPIHNWELYKVEYVDDKQLALEYVSAGSK